MISNENKKILKKCKKIKILLTDVDGVLTDGGMYYSSNGDFLKKFNARDGMGVNVLRRHKIPTIIVTKEKTSIVKKWASKMNIEQVFDGVLKKENVLEKICKKFKIKSDEVVFIGDDINDLELMKKVGFAATPHDGTKECIKLADYQCRTDGGKGVLREITDLIILAKFGSKKLY